MTRLIAWFVDNSISANLLMAVLVLGGLLTMFSLRQEEFPSIDTQTIQISVEYLGATPLEVEEAVCVRIEEAIEGTLGIDYMSATAAEGICGVFVSLLSGTDTTWVTSEIENRVNRITTFPNQTERPMNLARDG